MCCRYSLRKGLSSVAQRLGSYTLETTGGYKEDEKPRFNIAPGQKTLVLRKSAEVDSIVQATSMSWGLIPSWAKTPEASNHLTEIPAARAIRKPSFRGSIQRRRCLVPADGFYCMDPSPTHFQLVENEVFFMAGIWESWASSENEHFDSFAILTAPANALVGKYQESMPVILSGDGIREWLECEPEILDTADSQLFAPIDSELLKTSPANPKIKEPDFEGADCLHDSTGTKRPKFRTSVLMQNWINATDS